MIVCDLDARALQTFCLSQPRTAAKHLSEDAILQRSRGVKNAEYLQGRKTYTGGKCQKEANYLVEGIILK